MPIHISQNYLIALVPIALEIVGMILIVAIDPYIQKIHKRTILINIALLTTIVLQNLTEDYFTYYGDVPPTRTLLAIYAYVVRPVVILLFCYVIEPKKKHTPMWILLGVNAIINATAMFSHICFWIENNHFHRGPLGYSSHICSGILLMYSLYLVFSTAKSGRCRLQIIIPIFNFCTIVFAILLDTFIVHTQLGITYLTVAMVNSCLFLTYWLHLQFVNDHEKALMAEQRIKIMISQIQPHFLYNTLSSIQALCLSDPEKAFDVTERFGTYLRQNIDSLDQPQLIPFAKELEHTQVYAEIEMLRFPQIRVEYDTPDMNFSVPALTVQPLVENAIRHGIRGIENGTVRVLSVVDGDFHKITVSDNGKGFDAAGVEKSDSTHIGIRNVRERVEKMCGGTLTVESTVGAGTTVTIRLPKKK